MRIMTNFLAASALIVATTAAQAGGLAPEIMEAPVVAADDGVEPAGSSVSPVYIVLGVLAALLIAAAVNADDDDEEDTTTDTTDTDLTSMQ